LRTSWPPSWFSTIQIRCFGIYAGHLIVVVGHGPKRVVIRLFGLKRHDDLAVSIKPRHVQPAGFNVVIGKRFTSYRDTLACYA
jgi:hypothetical protein